ncbi:MAG: methyltransferase domain-containing protein [Gammaproteobacteria bacterium]|jgi:demethylmenaquinone methyltransferase/2-methoxy-6-polyprenyl-1,4-benzoquinol methylase|nr:methyltransferase domain-containing protein [Gammaproteobacteria bacterium]
MSAPDPQLALARYRAHAAGYDASAARTMPLRRRTIAKLALQPGETVLDVACGTGLSLPLLREAVGEDGRIVGVELSPDMLALARARCAREGWRNVTLIEGACEAAAIPGPVDAVLFNYTHDVLRSPAALARILAATRPGARVAVAGMKLAPWWLAPVNVLVRAQARPYMTTLEGLRSPWDLLEGHLASFARESVLFGTGYIGWGRVR